MCPYCSCVLVETIESERLELVWLSSEMIEALLEGRHDALDFDVPPDWPDEHDRRFLAFRLRQMTEEPERGPWLPRAIVHEGRMIGHIGFHGPPGVNARKEPAAAEVGYTVFEPYRRRGYATEAVRAVLGWAEGKGVQHFIASIAPDNEPSLALVRRLGFREIGRHWDEEDGEELEFELKLSGSSP